MVLDGFFFTNATRRRFNEMKWFSRYSVIYKLKKAFFTASVRNVRSDSVVLDGFFFTNATCRRFNEMKWFSRYSVIYKLKKAFFTASVRNVRSDSVVLDGLFFTNATRGRFNEMKWFSRYSVIYKLKKASFFKASVRNVRSDELSWNLILVSPCCATNCYPSLIAKASILSVNSFTKLGSILVFLVIHVVLLILVCRGISFDAIPVYTYYGII